MNRPENPTFGLIVPIYNEEEVLPQLLQRLRSLDFGMPLTVLLVDDGSTDRTLEIVTAACREDASLACLSFSRNFGHQTALSAGLQYIPGDIVGVIDADLQDPPELFERFIEKWRQGYDVVYGIRKNRQEAWTLRAAFRLFYWLLSKVSNLSIPHHAGDFALMDRRVVDAMNMLPEKNRFVRGLRVWVGFKQTGIPYSRPARAAGRTSYTIRHRSRFAFDGLLAFSSMPLRIASWAGMFAAMAGFGYLIYIVTLYLLGTSLVPGWASVIAIMLVLGGVQLLVLGIIGGYLNRIFDEAKCRPQFIARARLGWLASD